MMLDDVLAQPGVTVAYRWQGTVTMMLANCQTVVIETEKGWEPIPRSLATPYADWRAVWPRAIKDAEEILQFTPTHSV